MDTLYWPLIVAWGDAPSRAIPAGSWPFTQLFMGAQRCPCGGEYDWRDGEIFETLERFRATCDGCADRRDFWFDASLYVNDPLAGLRFEEMRQIFQSGLDRVEGGELELARSHFEEVSAREPWFALAHYHRGMLALVAERWAEARRHLSAAAGITPMDPSIRMALFDLATMQDDWEQADLERQVLLQLRELAGLEVDGLELEAMDGPPPQG